MSDRFLTRQLITLGLTANATRPIPGGAAAMPAFFAGWLTAELAPQLLTATTLDAVGHVARHGLGSRRALTTSTWRIQKGKASCRQGVARSPGPVVRPR